MIHLLIIILKVCLTYIFAISLLILSGIGVPFAITAIIESKTILTDLLYFYTKKFI